MYLINPRYLLHLFYHVPPPNPIRTKRQSLILPYHPLSLSVSEWVLSFFSSKCSCSHSSFHLNHYQPAQTHNPCNILLGVPSSISQASNLLLSSQIIIMMYKSLSLHMLIFYWEIICHFMFCATPPSVLLAWFSKPLIVCFHYNGANFVSTTVLTHTTHTIVAVYVCSTTHGQEMIISA